MSTPVPASTLDEILALQLTVAWAGEGRCEPPRLGWWQTDLVDPAGGGDLLERLLPRTHAWASLEAVREAARRTDAEARRKHADAERLRTLFHLGFELDERLDERLAQHKRHGTAPHAALPSLIPTAGPLDERDLAALLRPASSAGEIRIVPGGRELRGPPPAAPELMARHLAAALIPLAPQYPLPFYRMPA